MIEVIGVNKIYGKKSNAFTALHDVNLKIPTGASVAIVGKSGSGKSTLMHIMSGLDRPTSGSVSIGGDNIAKLKSRALDEFRSKKIGFVFQSFFIEGNESVYSNASLPLEIAGVKSSMRKRLVEKALAEVGLEDKIKTKARNLSGGQKQRLAVARAIVNSPKIIFADEPTGNLDSVTGKMIEDLLFLYNKKFGATLIIVTHNHDLAARCDLKIGISDGRIGMPVASEPKSTSQPRPTSRPRGGALVNNQPRVRTMPNTKRIVNPKVSSTASSRPTVNRTNKPRVSRPPVVRPRRDDTADKKVVMR